MTEDPGPTTGDQRPTTADRGPMTEERRRRAGDRRNLPAAATTDSRRTVLRRDPGCSTDFSLWPGSSCSTAVARIEL
jgi:hypothetical protein